jgi:hypothetical protein
MIGVYIERRWLRVRWYLLDGIDVLAQGSSWTKRGARRAVGPRLGRAKSAVSRESAA